MNINKKVNFPIDIVITWVDQTDPKWQAKFKKYGLNQDDTELRYRDYGTLKYVFRSIEKYASWVNHVFLVTDNQIPKWLNVNNSKLTVTDHKEIIPMKYLPTFNSNVIDFHLKNIPNLSEHFVYFNDDTFLTDYTRKNDFFSPEGFIRDNLAYNVLIPSSHPGDNFDHIYINNLQVINNFFNKYQTQKKLFWKLFSLNNMQWNLLSFLFFPFPRYSRFFDPHIPLGYRRSTFIQVLKQYKIIENMFENKVRKDNDYSIWLIRYFELLNGNFNSRYIKFGHSYSLEDMANVARDIKKNAHKVICVNDADVSEIDFNELIGMLSKVLEKKFPNKSCFEK